MNETKQKLAPGIFDNHGLRLWHDWQALTAQTPEMEAKWRYERDETGSRLAGPGECLSQTVGNVHLRVILGGDGRYTPLAEMIDTCGVKTAGPERIRTSVSPERTNSLLLALFAAEEAASEIGQPQPLNRRGRAVLGKSEGKGC